MANKRNYTPGEIKFYENLYVEKGLSPQLIADEYGINIKTIYAWRDKYAWDESKDLFTSGPLELKKILLREATRIAKREIEKDEQGNPIPTIDADSLSKIMKAYEYMNKQISPVVFRDVFVEFDNWMSGVDPKLAISFTKFHKMFLQEKIEQES